MTSAFGAFMDSVLDRYADALIILGLTMWAAGDDSTQRVWVVGFWAMAGSFAVTYTRARIEGVSRDLFDKGIASAASRDVRLFVVMIGALVGQGFATLIVLAVLSNSVVLLRLMHARRVLKEE
jgi:phosphatidylglycerophosphate synthase